MSADHRNGNSTNAGPMMCQKGCGLYGNVSLDGMCFRCFRASLEPIIEGPESTSNKVISDATDVANISHVGTDSRSPRSARRNLKLNIPLKCMGDDATVASPALSMVSNCSGRMTPITEMSSPIGSPMLRRPPSRLGFVCQNTELPSPASCPDLRRLALSSGRITPEVETRRYTDVASGRSTPDPITLTSADNDDDRIIIEVQPPSPACVSDLDANATNKGFHCEETGSSEICLDDKTTQENTKSISESKYDILILDLDKADALSETESPCVSPTTSGLDTDTIGESASATMGSSGEELRLFLSPSTPDPRSPRFSPNIDAWRMNFRLDNQTPDMMSPEPDLSREYAYSDSNVVDGYHNEAYADFMSDDYISYMNARRAADLEWITSNPDLYYQYLMEQEIDEREFFESRRRADYVSVTAHDYLHYLSDRELADSRFDIPPQELDRLMADVDRVSAVYGPEYGMYTTRDKAREEYNPYAEEAARLYTCQNPRFTPATGEEDRKEEKEKKNKKKRCHVCRKKVGLTGFDCRCGGHYCSLHRYSDTHECTFDYKEHGKDKIRKDNPVIVGEKIRKI